MRNIRRSRLVAACTMVAVLVLGAGCSETGLPVLEPTTSAGASGTADAGGNAGSVKPSTLSQARQQLGSLEIKTIPGRDSSYERDAFGDSWSDAATGVQFGRNGCDTRNDILRRDAVPGTIRTKTGTSGCKVTAGAWVSEYNGARYTNKSKIQIDHIVPLSRAWASGAKRWSAARRLAFANDPDNLLAVDGSSNQSKSDKGPSAWRPPKQYQCAYAVRYVRAVSKYDLPITKSDKSALTGMLDGCRT
ncbi:HNH endonuclease family protein [Cryptosporangium minutisporangium]|uniref:HNH endonuclease family protein n=1 Tax=Cryptosporangium minutisporangium TaxID=113569 RepID=UPI0031E885EF